MHGSHVSAQARPLFLHHLRDSWQVILQLPLDVKDMYIGQTFWRVNYNKLHDRCEKNKKRWWGLSLSSSPPSSAKNVDGAGPTNMLGDLLGKKSQLYLKPFGVGVLAVGCMLFPWPRFQTEASKMSLLVARVWLLQQVKEVAWVVLTHWEWDESTPWKPVIVRN